MDSTSSATSQKNVLAMAAKDSLGLLFSAILLAGLGNWLLRAMPGLNWTLFALMILLTIMFWSRRLEQSLNPVLLLSLFSLSLVFPLRASPFLQSLNVLVWLFLFTLMLARLSFGALFQTNFLELLVNLIRGLFEPLISFFRFLFESRWSDLSLNSGYSKTLLAIFRGLLFALPLLIIFALLLASADVVFERLFTGLFDIDLERIGNHLIFIGFLSLVLIAVFAQLFIGGKWQSLELQTPGPLQFGRIETSLVFGSLIALFFSFLVIQFGYLFGGAARVLETGLTYAEYGRRGFFELVFVAFLLHLVLLSGLWLVREAKAFELFRVLAITLVFLLFGVIWSAYSRLGLYIETFGLTELRYYSTAMIFWIAVVMLYFVFRLLRAAPRIAPSYLVLGILGVLSLYLSNPDAQIARVNLERFDKGVSLDSYYLSQLSGDAVPVIYSYLLEHKGVALPDLEAQFESSMDQHDWRSFNYGRWNARRLAKAFKANDVP